MEKESEISENTQETQNSISTSSSTFNLEAKKLNNQTGTTKQRKVVKQTITGKPARLLLGEENETEDLTPDTVESMSGNRKRNNETGGKNVSVFKPSTLYFISFWMGLFFIIVGYMKISPRINRAIYKEMVTQFKIYHKKVPLLITWRRTGQLTIGSAMIRKTLGYFEVIAGMIFVICPERSLYGKFLKVVSNLMLIFAMGVNSYLHLKVKDPIGKYPTYSYVLFFLVFGKFILGLVAYYNWSSYPECEEYIESATNRGGMCSTVYNCYSAVFSKSVKSEASPSPNKKRVKFTESTKGGSGMAGMEADWKKFR